MADVLSKMAGALSAVIYIAVLVLAIRQAFTQLSVSANEINPNRLQPSGQNRRSGESGEARDNRTIFLWFAISGILIFAVGMYSNALINNPADTFLGLLRSTFVRSDATPYLGIAQNGYVTEGDARYHIVFFPAYPYVVRVFSYLTGDYLLTAIVLSNVFLFIGCVVMFKLGCIDYGRDVSLRAVKLLLVSPVAFFFRLPFTESMFLMFTALALYACRKEKYVLSGLFGLVAALTRMTGVIVLGVIIVEASRSDSRRWRDKETKSTESSFVGREAKLPPSTREGASSYVKSLIKKAWPALLVPVGTLLYLFINYAVTGDPFKFSEYQRENWSNWFSPFPNQVRTITSYMLQNTEAHTMILWYSQFIAMFSYLAIMLFGYKKLRASHNAYNLAYYFGTTSINWLLSSPRYLMCMFPAYYALAAIASKKYQSAICFTLSIIGLVIMTIAFAIGRATY